MTQTARRHDLDWLRVIAILLLHVYHTGMAFVTWSWHIKSDVLLPEIEMPMHMLSLFRMPLLFLISGVATTFVLRRRGAWGYLGERSRRLLLPLAFGMLVIVPPQVYFERLTQGISFASLTDFYATVLRLESYPQGNFSWHHLWFVAYLFVFCLLLTPVFAWMRGESGKKRWQALQAGLSRPWVLASLGIPLVASQVILRPISHNDHALVGDWVNLIYFGLLFFYGFLIGTAEDIWSTLARLRHRLLGAALLLTWPAWGMGLPWMPWRLIFLYCFGWIVLLAVLGYAYRHLNRPNRVIRYANQGIYPFYILHQTAIVWLAFYLLPLPLSVWTRFFLLMAASFLASWLAYEFLIRRSNLLRPFFGMKPKTNSAPSPDISGSAPIGRQTGSIRRLGQRPSFGRSSNARSARPPSTASVNSESLRTSRIWWKSWVGPSS
ncbi:MAG TPA: acyltransferase [Acidobacteriota bacterium]|nr:acyltransferase [Acidobacteriota bacterium]